MYKFAKAVRIATLAPIIAFILVTLVYFLIPASFGVTEYILAIVFLTVLPLLGYPLQPFIPKFRDKGREGQRNLAMLMAVIGYVLGIVFALCMNVTGILLVIYLTYLFSGLIMVLFNKVLKIRASGHACGFAGPLAVIICLFGAWAYTGLALLVLVFWACLKMKRHTLSQLFIGSLIPVLALLLALLVTGTAL